MDACVAGGEVPADDAGSASSFDLSRWVSAQTHFGAEAGLGPPRDGGGGGAAAGGDGVLQSLLARVAQLEARHEQVWMCGAGRSRARA
eukprot:184847-Chlamydomonas_euryale.AAC.1